MLDVWPSLDVADHLWLFIVQTVIFITGSVARSASRRYLIYSEADFELFRPTGATRCTDGGEIWRGGGEGTPRLILPPSVQ